MHNKERSDDLRQKRKPRLSGFALIALNVLLIASVLVIYTLYNNAYKERLRYENLGNIANLNKSAAVNTTTLFESWAIKLDDIASYANHHELSVEELLSLISDSNSSDERCFELIGSDYTGYLAKKNPDGSYLSLDYSHNSYAPLKLIFDGKGIESASGINFVPEFTDGGETAEKFFAIYKYISLTNADGELENYTLLLAASSKSILERLNMQSDYDGQSTVLINASGDYIVSSRDYKSNNFFQYLYVYNELTLDQKNEIINEVNKNGSGDLYYKNVDVVVEDCVFHYERMELDGWYCVTCVPLSSFREPTFNNNYLIYIVVILLVLLILDVLWLQKLNRKLSLSVQHEKDASAAKGVFMSRMSHEIRTPLNAVIGYNAIANNELSSAKTDEERRQAEMRVMDCLAKSEIASKHLLTIINDVLDMSAIESGRVMLSNERFDFKNLITSLTTVFYAQASGKGVKFNVVFKTPTDEWFVGDQVRVNQILMNLLSNAIKFTPKNGQVTLSLSQSQAGADKANIHFEVTDTGIGMTDEYLSHIWTPFEQADSSISRRFGGTGLGLSITRSLVDLMNGEITVESMLGKGSTFRVDLTFGKTEQPLSTDIYDFSSIKALIVEDSIETCDYICFLFTRCAVDCVAVTSGEDALKAIIEAHQQGQDYTLCIIDWHMPGMDGIETMHGIRNIAGDKIPIIVLTAYDFSEVANMVDDTAMVRFVTKPLFQSSLFDLLVTISVAGNFKETKTAEAPIRFSGEKTLLVEDNAMNMEIAKKILEHRGLSVDEACNGREAVEKFCASSQGTYSLILMDVHMPEMNGLDATRAIRSSSHPDAKTIPIVAMTADAFTENVAEAISSGMNDHIAKPIDQSCLFNTLSKYINDKGKRV